MKEALREEVLRKEVLEKLNGLIPGADAELKLKVKGSDCEIEGEGNIAGMLLAFSSIVEEIKEYLEKIGMNRKLVKFLLENSFYTVMEETDE